MSKEKESRTELDAWHYGFGTSQLTHALERLRKAERDRELLRTELERSVRRFLVDIEALTRETILDDAWALKRRIDQLTSKLDKT